MLQPFITALVPFLPGMVELPESYGARLFALTKGASHKYVRRVPKAGGGYRYFYHVGHGGGVANADHFVEGAAFRYEGGHFHISKTDGDKLTIRHDETGETKTVTKAALREMLSAHHSEGLKAHREKAHADLADARKAGASAKQIARLEARAKAAGGDAHAAAKERDDHKAKVESIVSDAMKTAAKREFKPGDKAKIREFINAAVKAGFDGKPMPDSGKKTYAGKFKHSIGWAYSSAAMPFAESWAEKAHAAATLHGGAHRAAESLGASDNAPAANDAKDQQPKPAEKPAAVSAEARTTADSMAARDVGKPDKAGFVRIVAQDGPNDIRGEYVGSMAIHKTGMTGFWGVTDAKSGLRITGNIRDGNAAKRVAQALDGAGLTAQSASQLKPTKKMAVSSGLMDLVDIANENGSDRRLESAVSAIKAALAA